MFPIYSNKLNNKYTLMLYWYIESVREFLSFLQYKHAKTSVIEQCKDNIDIIVHYH